jgi:hypothetical protein
VLLASLTVGGTFFEAATAPGCCGTAAPVDESYSIGATVLCGNPQFGVSFEYDFRFLFDNVM